ncbi:hypothetical protein [Spirochaeta cellobiosiphila]|uniref:hypothetical protein n=1 Tax=Spirochaeta cellobiosiphila TaxID=504483 RepID=UPI0004136FD9|nr:hypothetical protein [Spirochaeta cellobiosiphila]
MKRFLILFFLLITTLSYGVDEYLTGVIYFPLGPRNPDELEEPPVDEEVFRRILEEARYIFSGMIYGYHFTYTPSDKNRQIKEYYEIEPIKQIPWGDKRLKIRSSRRVDRNLYITVEYYLNQAQIINRQHWNSANIPTAGGFGSANYFLGWESRFKSIDNGIKEAIRNYLRPREFNKPREITGEALLIDVPSFTVESGKIHANVRVHLNITEIVPYKSF